MRLPGAWHLSYELGEDASCPDTSSQILFRASSSLWSHYQEVDPLPKVVIVTYGISGLQMVKPPQAPVCLAWLVGSGEEVGGKRAGIKNWAEKAMVDGPGWD